MAGVAEEVDLEELAHWAQGQAAIWRDPDFRKPLEISRVLVANDIKENFQGSHDPAGNAWPPLKSARQAGAVRPGSGGTRRSSTTKHPLWDTGALVRSTGAGAGHVEELSKTELVYGTNLVYAAIHNFGGTINMPERSGHATVEPHTEGLWANFEVTKFRFARPNKKRYKPGSKSYLFKIGAHSITMTQRQFIGIGDALSDKIDVAFAEWSGERLAE